MELATDEESVIPVTFVALVHACEKTRCSMDAGAAELTCPHARGLPSRSLIILNEPVAVSLAARTITTDSLPLEVELVVPPLNRL